MNTAERNVLKQLMQIATVQFQFCKIMIIKYKLNVIYLITMEIIFKEDIKAQLNNLQLSIELGKKILDQVGQKKINQLNVLEDDFDYTPKAWGYKIKKIIEGLGILLILISSRIINLN